LSSVLSVGVGKSILEKHKSFERYSGIGIRYGSSIVAQANGGYYLATGTRERSSWYGSVQGGLVVTNESGFHGQMLAGPTYIDKDDSKITGHFQFHLTGGVGIENTSRYGLDIVWNHFSNAGMKQPNYGRDFITLQAIIPIYEVK
jgi:hypothetical protein